MADKLNIEVTVRITNADDGASYYTDAQSWSGVPYPATVAIQGFLLEALAKIHGLGAAQAQGKGLGRK